MKVFVLYRLQPTENSTFGYMEDEEQNRVCVTLELPWKDNAHMISCIPPGDYTAFRRMSPKRGYEVFQLKDVPGRDNIEIHIGNFPRDTDGCILLGSSYDGADTILRSKDAFDKFMALVADVDLIGLTIHNPQEVIADDTPRTT